MKHSILPQRPVFCVLSANPGMELVPAGLATFVPRAASIIPTATTFISRATPIMPE